MANFKCKCGYLMGMRTGNEPYEHRLIQSNIWFKKYFDFIDSLPPIIDVKKDEDDELDRITSMFMDGSRSLLRCPECGRIYIDFNDDNKYKMFKPEDY